MCVWVILYVHTYFNQLSGTIARILSENQRTAHTHINLIVGHLLCAFANIMNFRWKDCETISFHRINWVEFTETLQTHTDVKCLERAYFTHSQLFIVIFFDRCDFVEQAWLQHACTCTLCAHIHKHTIDCPTEPASVHMMILQKNRTITSICRMTLAFEWILFTNLYAVNGFQFENLYQFQIDIQSTTSIGSYPNYFQFL